MARSSRRAASKRARRSAEDPATVTAPAAGRAVAPPSTVAPRSRPEQVRIVSHPFVRAGIFAWAAIGLALTALGVLYVVGLVRLVVTPLVLALFPAALLMPIQKRLQRLGAPPALAALLVLLASIGVLVLIGFVLVPQIADEIPVLREQVEDGLGRLQAYLDTGPFGLDPEAVREFFTNVQSQITQSDGLRTGVLGAAGAVAELTTSVLLLLVVLFFYLKDGDRIAAWIAELFPRPARGDVSVLGDVAWNTVGAYFRGQLFIAFVDGLLIGVGAALLGVPLPVPLGVLVFFGALFPIVGAIVSGAVAVLVALASGGFSLALWMLIVVVGVQQIEGNFLAPVVLGRATELHPLAVITALTVGGILLGILGAFLAVPVAASLARSIGYLRNGRQLPAPAA